MEEAEIQALGKRHVDLEGLKTLFTTTKIIYSEDNWGGLNAGMAILLKIGSLCIMHMSYFVARDENGELLQSYLYLPSSYKPKNGTMFTVPLFSSDGTFTTAYIGISTDGSIQLDNIDNISSDIQDGEITTSLAYLTD